MIELVVGEKGKGKTKILMAKANNDIKITGGNIIYFDKNNKHMYELSNRVKLMNIPEYHVHSADMFLGFLYGVVSQQQDLDKIFLDNFMSISCVESMEQTEQLIREISVISEQYEIDFMIGLSKKKEELTDYLKDFVTVAL